MSPSAQLDHYIHDICLQMRFSFSHIKKKSLKVLGKLSFSSCSLGNLELEILLPPASFLLPRAIGSLEISNAAECMMFFTDKATLVQVTALIFCIDEIWQNLRSAGHSPFEDLHLTPSMGLFRWRFFLHKIKFDRDFILFNHIPTNFCSWLDSFVVMITKFWSDHFNKFGMKEKRIKHKIQSPTGDAKIGIASP